jgi:branched-subunit amino acid transport protein
MPKLSHWIVQYLIAVVSMFGLLLVIDLLMRGETFARAWPSSLIWAVVASALFIGTRYRNMKRGIECVVCNTLDKK